MARTGESTAHQKEVERDARDTRPAGMSALAVYPVDEVCTIVEESIVVYKTSIWYVATKRLFDVVFALIGILLLLPVFLIVAAAIKLNDGASILYFREIVGLRGQRFFALKFRTMILNADDYLEKHPEIKCEFNQHMKLLYDPRVTRIGGFLRRMSLDELPQLFNVLIGQMSLVGPRMIHPSELSRYGKYAQKRLSVKPGITGLWQLYGRQQDSLEKRITLDMQYIDSRSLLLDLMILLKTVKVFVVHTGV
jgi:lipopolysaccharide/colanic/teichoic acid biosynthesis glycosyltransferase